MNSDCEPRTLGRRPPVSAALCEKRYVAATCARSTLRVCDKQRLARAGRTLVCEHHLLVCKFDPTVREVTSNARITIVV
jgi:hypothetical protein